MDGEDAFIEEMQKRFSFQTTLERFDSNLFIHFATKDRKTARFLENNEIKSSSSASKFNLECDTDIAAIRQHLKTLPAFVVIVISSKLDFVKTFDYLHELIKN